MMTSSAKSAGLLNCPHCAAPPARALVRQGRRVAGRRVAGSLGLLALKGRFRCSFKTVEWN